MRPFVSPPPQRLRIAFWLCTLLLAAQMLGLAHHVLHAPGLHGHDALFAGHEAGGAECRLVDQIGDGAPPTVVLLALPPAPPQAQPGPAASPAAQVLAAARCAARAPPRG